MTRYGNWKWLVEHPGASGQQTPVDADLKGCEQATITSFKIGWNFTAGETIRQQQDIYTPGIDAILIANSTVQIQSFSNNTVRPLNWTSFSFLGYKREDPTAFPVGNPYGVRPLLPLPPSLLQPPSQIPLPHRCQLACLSSYSTYQAINSYSLPLLQAVYQQVLLN